MRYRSIIGSLAGACLMMAPIPAIAQSAPEPAVESVEEGAGLKSGRRGDKFMMYALVGATVLAILLLLVLIKDERQELPISP